MPLVRQVYPMGACCTPRSNETPVDAIRKSEVSCFDHCIRGIGDHVKSWKKMESKTTLGEACFLRYKYVLRFPSSGVEDRASLCEAGASYERDFADQHERSPVVLCHSIYPYPYLLNRP